MGRTPSDFQNYLTCLARLQVEPGLGVKVDLSGIVQQTLLEATSATDVDFPTWEETRQKAWLRRLLANNLRDALRAVSAAKRAWNREKSLEAALDSSSLALDKFLAGKDPSPSQKAMKAEDLEHLTNALGRLPAPQREAIEGIHLQGRSLGEISAAMGRTKGAVAALLYRGLKQLREWLREEPACDPQA